MRRFGKELDMQEFYPEELRIAAVDQDESVILLKIVYSDRRAPLARCFRASLTEGENHLHGD